jgi:hypothetical protein
VQPQRTPAATAATTCEKLLVAAKTELQKKTARVEGLEQQILWTRSLTSSLRTPRRRGGGSSGWSNSESKSRWHSEKSLDAVSAPPPVFACVHTMPFTNLPLLHMLGSSRGAHEEDEGLRDPQGSK